MTEATHTFRCKSFRVLEGKTHPAYSLTCFATEEADFRDKYWHPEPGQVVVDVGASYGAYTLTAAVLGADVIAFEPDDAIRADLRRNVELNGLYSRVSVRGYGLWDKSEDIDMSSYAPHWPAGTVANKFPMVTLDSFTLPKVDWLKIDVEGAEAHVLRGALETIKRCKPTLIVEVHTFLDAGLMAKCEAALAATGVEYLLEEVPRGECVMLVGRAV